MFLCNIFANLLKTTYHTINTFIHSWLTQKVQMELVGPFQVSSYSQPVQQGCLLVWIQTCMPKM
jgi:hypothetical protein